MKYLSSLKTKDLSREVVLLRVDLNIDPKEAEYSPRVHEIIPTLDFLHERGARVILMSHRGRPKGKYEKKYSLRPYERILDRRTSYRVTFAKTFASGEYTAGDLQTIKKSVEKLENGEVVLLENLRFLPGEEKNSRTLAKKLAKLGTMYINDAFGVSHRKNASVHAITQHIPSFAGLLLESEIANLSRVMKAPKRPLVIVLGGAKVSDKIGVIEQFLPKVHVFCVGGAMANTFLKARGERIRQSVYEKDAVSAAEKLLATGKIILPVDSVWHNGRILDIGPKTRRMFSDAVRDARTVVWNGPLGLAEKQGFAAGTKTVARAIARSEAFSVVGGGETVEIIERMKMQEKFSFISTGGGAMLEFLSGKELPGIKALETS